MRNVIWLFFLFVAAVAAALFLGENRATVTLFWHPYRIDMSLNLLLVALLVFGTLAVFVWRTFSGLRSVRQQVGLQKQLQTERSLAQSQLASAQSLSARQYADALQAASAAVHKATQYRNTLQQARKPDAAALAHANTSLALANWLADQATHALPEGDAAATTATTATATTSEHPAALPAPAAAASSPSSEAH